MDHRLIFIHIPKAAGTTVRQIIGRFYDAEKTHDIYSIEGIAHFKELSPEVRHNIQYLHGHFAYGLHSRVPSPVYYATMLRCPVDRIVSLYYFAKTDTGGYLYDAINSADMSLSEFVHSDLSSELFNFQTALLSGFDGEATVRTEIGPADLARAKQRLRDDITVFGLLERFERSLLLYNLELGWKASMEQLAYTRRNVTAGRPHVREIPPSIRARIEQINQLDCELYDYAKRLFNSRLKKLQPWLQIDLWRLRRAIKEVSAGR